MKYDSCPSYQFVEFFMRSDWLTITLYLKGIIMSKVYRDARKNETAGEFIARVQDNIKILQGQYESAADIGKPVVREKLKSEVQLYVITMTKLINDGEFQSDPAGILNQKPVKHFAPIVLEITKEIMGLNDTAEEAIEQIEAVAKTIENLESVDHIGLTGKLKIGVYGAGFFLFDIAKGVVSYIYDGVVQTYRFFVEKACQLKDWMLWMFKSNTAMPESLIRPMES